MTSERLVVLGATGSIGSQTLEVARERGSDVVGLAARRASDELAALAEQWPNSNIVVTGATSDEVSRFAQTVGANRVSVGSDAMDDLAGIDATIVNGVVGVAGLRPSVAALEAGNRLALANKESLVAGGDVLMAALDAGGGSLIPVDSEHSAIHQLLDGIDRDHVHRIVLTASGGPFRGRTRSELLEVTPEQALAHPTWEMGNRISIDSATLANKGLEVIEAAVLFGRSVDSVEVVVHPQSIVHSMLRLRDGAVLAHLGKTSMLPPIEYAMSYPHRADHSSEPFDLTARDLTFEPPDVDSFPALRLAYEAGRAAGSAPVVFNAADEVAVAAFLQGRLGFMGIPALIERCLDESPHSTPESIEAVLDVDREARSLASSLVASAC